MKNFLDLYVNFKMKLRDAEIRGYDTNPELLKELNDYQEKVGVTFILEKQIVDPGVKELFNRRKYELRVSHLMIRPEGNDSLAKQRANSILDSIKNGAGFEEMVSKYSQDTYSKPIGGDIYYITAGMLPPSFEDAAYNTKVGEVYPYVVKTKFGYHIIKVTEKRDRIAQIRASHILASFRKPDGTIDSAAAKAKIDSVKEALKKGADFAELAEKYSDDPGSKEKGGDLGFFSRRMMVKEFDEAAFNLKKGEVSDIIKTQYGYHIIKLTDEKPGASFDEEKEELKKIFQKTRFQDTYNALIDSLGKKYNFKLNQNTFNFITDNNHDVKVGDEYKKMDEMRDKEIFSYAGKSETAGDLLQKIQNEPEFSNKKLEPETLREAVNKVAGNLLLDEAAMNLDQTNPEFASLMKDYRNGIYIFKLQEEEVWNKVNVDSSKLETFYDSTKQNYVWPDRVNFSEIYSKNDSLINHYYDLLKQGENFDSLAAKYTERPGYRQRLGNFGFQDAKGTQLAVEANKLKATGDFSEPIKNAGGYSIVLLIAKDPSHIKTYEEAKPEVAGAYQEAESKRLEKAYLNRLVERYQPEIFYDELSEAYKNQ